MTLEPARNDLWAHAGVHFVPNEGIVIADATGASLHAVQLDGSALRWGTFPDFTSMHDMAVIPINNAVALWVCDTGHATASGPHGDTADVWGQPGVFTIDNASANRHVAVEPNQLPEPLRGWRPSGIAVVHDTVWIADGYGRSVVHCVTPTGRYLWTIDGGESGLTFDCPHGLCLDERGEGPRVVVLDRGRSRLCAFTVEGTFLKDFASTSLPLPTAAAVVGDRMWVTDLTGFIGVFDRCDRLIRIIATKQFLNPGDQDFAPHGIAVSPDGTIFVSEWGPAARVLILRPTGGASVIRL